MLGNKNKNKISSPSKPQRSTTPLDRRSSDRIPLSRRAKLITPDNQVYEALIHDASETGFFVICAAWFTAGQILELEFNLNQNTVFRGSVEVRHWCNDGIGVKIIDLDKKTLGHFSRVLDIEYKKGVTQSRSVNNAPL